MQDPFRVAFLPGVSPDKWSKRWRERYPETPLDLTMVDVAEQRAVLTDGRASMAFVRLPIDRDGLHVIGLYDEVSVAVISVEDDLSLHDTVTIADLADRQLVTDPADLPAWTDVATVERLAFPPMSAKDAVEVVASGTGVAVLPMSVARLHHRKDVVARELTDGPLHPVGIAWLRPRPGQEEDPRIETFVGIVRGRSANSSRGAETPPQPKPKKAAAKAATPRKAAPRKGAAATRRTTKSAKRPKRR
jgi:DNA-binding transcriptional LysR family regulator